MFLDHELLRGLFLVNLGNGMASPVYDGGKEFEVHLEGGESGRSLTENPVLPSIMPAPLRGRPQDPSFAW